MESNIVEICGGEELINTETLKLRDIVTLLLYAKNENIKDKVKRGTATSSFIRATQKRNIKPIKIKGYENSYSKEDILNIFSGLTKKYKILKETSWEDILILLENAKNKERELQENIYKEKNKNFPLKWHLKLESQIEESFSKGESIKSLLKEHYEKIKNEFIDNDTNKNTAINIVMNHRNLLKKLIQKKDLPKKKILIGMFEKDYRTDFQEALKYYQIPDSIMIQAKKEQLEKVRESLSDLKELPIKKEDFDSFLDKLFQSDKLEDRALGVYLATGRRKEEILEHGVFREDKKDKKKLYMKGALKKLDKEEELHFPILYDQETVLKVIQEIREKELNYYFLKKHLQENYKDTLGNLHNLRKLYGMYSYILMSKDSKHINLWLNEVLGHEEENLSTSFHYSNYKLPKD